MNKEIKKMILVGLLLLGILIGTGLASAENNQGDNGKLMIGIVLILAIIGAFAVLGKVWQSDNRYCKMAIYYCDNYCGNIWCLLHIYKFSN